MLGISSILSNYDLFVFVPFIFYDLYIVHNLFTTFFSYFIFYLLPVILLSSAYRYPIYGSQWHPEKIAFVWKTSLAIDHSLHAQRVAQYMANFFVSEGNPSQMFSEP